MRVVSRDVDVVDVVSLAEVLNSFDPRSTVVSDNLYQGAPLPDEATKKPLSDSLGCLPVEHVEFRLMTQRTAALN